MPAALTAAGLGRRPRASDVINEHIAAMDHCKEYVSSLARRCKYEMQIL